MKIIFKLFIVNKLKKKYIKTLCTKANKAKKNKINKVLQLQMDKMY